MVAALAAEAAVSCVCGGLEARDRPLLRRARRGAAHGERESTAADTKDSALNSPQDTPLTPTGHSVDREAGRSNPQRHVICEFLEGKTCTTAPTTISATTTIVATTTPPPLRIAVAVAVAAVVAVASLLSSASASGTISRSTVASVRNA